MNNPKYERQRRYRERHPDRIKKRREALREYHKEYMKKWYVENKESIRKKQKEHDSIPEVMVRKKQYLHNHYLANKNKYMARRQKSRDKVNEFRKRVVMQYGCQNPNCKWIGDFIPGQLEFHHLDPKTKIVNGDKEEIGQLCSIKKLIKAMNKCVVLCSNCHFAVHHGGDVPIDASMLCRIESENN